MPRLTINRIIRMRLYRELAGIYRINGLDNEVCVIYVRLGVDMADTSLRVAVNNGTHGSRKYHLSRNIIRFEQILQLKTIGQPLLKVLREM